MLFVFENNLKYILFCTSTICLVSTTIKLETLKLTTQNFNIIFTITKTFKYFYITYWFSCRDYNSTNF